VAGKRVVSPCVAHESGGSDRGAMWQRGYNLELGAQHQWRTGERIHSEALTGGSHPQQSRIPHVVEVVFVIDEWALLQFHSNFQSNDFQLSYSSLSTAVFFTAHSLQQLFSQSQSNQTHPPFKSLVVCSSSNWSMPFFWRLVALRVHQLLRPENG
jgi:hypothetical protein